MVMVDDFLGRGLSIPFRRDKARDFASASGEALVRSAVAQVLGTVGASDFTQGELPWRTEFGSLLHLLRHQKNDVALREMAKVYVQDALRRWEPRIIVTRLDAERLDDNQGSKLVLRLRYNVIQRNVPGNQVLLEGIEQTIAL
jgi:phage baseplate assembly protein W